MSSRVYSIDSLRAIAMTMVIAQHCGLLPFGWTGVWLFYVISGFVISRNFIEERATAGLEPAGHFLSFLVRRTFRIVPPYAGYILLCLIAAHFIALPAQVREIPYLATFTYNWRMIFSLEPQSPVLGHLWTISVEEQFYVIFPWIVLLLRRDLAIRVLVAILVSGPIARVILAHYLSTTFDPLRSAFGVYASSLGQFDAFAMGSLLAHFERNVRRSPEIAKKMLWLALGVGIIYAGTYTWLNALGGARGIDIVRNVFSGILFGQMREVFVYVAIDLAAAAIVAGVLAGWRIFKFLEHPKLISIGQASYAGYLLHLLVVVTVGQITGSAVANLPIAFRLVMFCVVLSCTVILARMSYSMFERRFIRYGHQISNRILGRVSAGEGGLTVPVARSETVVAPGPGTERV